MSKTLALMLVSALAVPVAPQTPSIDQYVQDYARQAGYPGVSVVITKGAEVVLARGYGHNSSGAPMTAQTPMPAASLSKSFTALAVMQLAEAGNVDLDRPVRDYLPGFQIQDPHQHQLSSRRACRGSRCRPTVHEPAILTGREREVLALLGKGLSNAQIARRLHLVEGTVKGHVSAILTRLEAGNRVQAAIMAHDAELV